MGGTARVNPEGIKNYINRNTPLGFGNPQAYPEGAIPGQADPNFDNAPMDGNLGFNNPQAIYNLADSGGAIPGRVNQKIADDVTIDAKKGEYVLPVEAVAALGGTKAIDSMVQNIKTKLGIPAETGPKTRSEPDAQGRMNAVGMRGYPGGGVVKDPETDLTSSDLRGITRNTNPPGYEGSLLLDPNAGSSLAGGLTNAANAVQSVMPSVNNPYETNVSKLAASGGATNVVDRYVNAAASSLAGGVGNLWGRFANDPNFFGPGKAPSVTPTAPPTVPPISSPISNQTDRTPIDWTQAAKNATKNLPGFGMQRNMDQISTTYDPTADNASRDAAQARSDAAYKASAAQQDAALANQQDAQRLTGLRTRADALARPQTMAPLDMYHQGFVGDANMSNPSYKNALGEQAVWKSHQDANAGELANTNAQIANLTGLKMENMKGGFDLDRQRLMNEGNADTQNIAGGFRNAEKKISTPLDPSVVAENTARTGLMNKQAAGLLSKEEQMKLSLLTEQAKAKEAGRAKLASNPNLTPEQLQSSLDIYGMNPGDTYEPPTPGENPGFFRKNFLGQQVVPPKPGHVVKASSEGAPPGGAFVGYDPNGNKVYTDMNGNKVVAR